MCYAASCGREHQQFNGEGKLPGYVGDLCRENCCFVTIRWPGRHAKSKVAGQLLTVVRVTTATATSQVRLTTTAVEKQRILIVQRLHFLPPVQARSPSSPPPHHTKRPPPTLHSLYSLHTPLPTRHHYERSLRSQRLHAGKEAAMITR